MYSNSKSSRSMNSAMFLALAVSIPSVAEAETLQELAQRTHFHGIAFTRAGSAELTIASHHGLFAVVADGTVQQVSPTQDFMGFAPDPSDPLSYFASGHPATGGNSGFLRSRDGGANWTQLSEGAGGPVDFHQMAVSYANSAVIYGSFGDIQTSIDGGSTWAVSGSAPDDLIALEASSLDANRLYAATEGGLFQSENSEIGRAHV